jgi:retron-type reverse transcriptase
VQTAATGTMFTLRPTTSDEVIKLISSISDKKATGLDQIPSKLLKLSAPIVSKSLCDIFNLSIQTAIFPDDWKLAKVSPIYKGDAKDNVGNYRPISVLSAISKVFERIVFDQLYTYFNENNLLHKNQSGFRKCHSTMTALIDATIEWLTNMDQGKLNAVVYIDLAKAFDTISHDILLEKLHIYGVDANSLSWFQSYLQDRKQKCYVNDVLSGERTINCGVPQGSILGPLLFLIYINDLPQCLKHSTARMYADDTNITTTGTSIREIVTHANDDLNNISDWLKANKLSLNVTKTEYMFIGSDQNLDKLSDVPLLFLENKAIKRVKATKSLGVHIDERLTWHEHIQNVSKKVGAGISGLRRVREFVPLSTLVTIYPRADGAKRRARVLIPPGYLHPGETKALAKSKVHQ